MLCRGRADACRIRGRAALAAAAMLLALMAGATCARAAAATFSAHGSADQVYVTGLGPYARMSLLNPRGRKIATKRADSLGGLLFRNVPPGSGYRVRLDPRGPRSGPLSVLTTRPAPPSTDVYNQTINSDGYQYLTTRDGTKLAIYVHPPQDVATALPAGIKPPQNPTGQPTPTLIEYSGYGYANPAGAESSIELIGNAMGFTVVDVNMRGTGCSGGAYDFFEPLQNLDGYDVIETIARQPWVLDHKVGMMGISYGGISQLFTAQLHPPSLEAIAPLSVIDQTATTLYPGGILNTGFAVGWAKERIHDAKPAGPNSGQPWANKQIQNGDQTCKENQVLHGEAADLMGKIRANNHYVAKVADPLAPITFVNKIHVPVFMACQWTDEQTGGHCPDLAEHFTGTQHKWFTFVNGDHIDSLDPATYDRWYDFLELYVAHQAPIMNAAVVQASAPAVYEAAMGINGVTLPPDPIQMEPNYDGALAQFEALPSIRVLFDNGGGNGGGQPYYPYAAFEQSWPRFPIPGTKARYWYLSARGALGDKPARRAGANSFTWNSRARPMNDFHGNDTGSSPGDLWTASPNYQWVAPRAGSAVSYLTAPLKSDAAVIGAGRVNVWVRSPVPYVDLQATVTEVRPDGNETFVQNGWAVGGAARLDRRKSTLLEPVLGLRTSDFSPLPRGRFVEVTIPLYYEGHVYRAGSRIRVTIAAPNGDQPVWSFGETHPKRGHPTVAIAYSRRMPSILLLPVVPGVNVSSGLPPCPGLRGEPCRPYQGFANRTARR